MQGFRRKFDELRHHLRGFYRFMEKEGLMDPAHLDLSAANKAVIADYQAYLCDYVSPVTGERIKAQTQTNRLIVLRLFFRFLKQTGRIQKDPCEVITLPRKAQQIPVSILSVKEVRKLLAAPDLTTIVGFRDRVILEVFWCTGMRASESAALEIDDIDFSQGSVLIREGKGGKERKVPIGKAVLGLLREYIDRVRPLLIKPYRPETNLLFLNSHGMMLSNFQEKVQNYRKQAGIRKQVGTHSFRHTLATEMLKAGADLRHIQEMLGHEQLSTTQRYLHVVKDDLKRVHAESHPRERGQIPGAL